MTPCGYRGPISSLISEVHDDGLAGRQRRQEAAAEFPDRRRRQERGRLAGHLHPEEPDQSHIEEIWVKLSRLLPVDTDLLLFDVSLSLENIRLVCYVRTL